MSTSAQFFLPAPSGAPSSSGFGAPPRGLRRWIDAATRDYVIEDGRLKDDDGFTSKVVLALSTRRGSCQVLPSFGSRLHEIRTADERGRRLAEAYGLAAIAHLTSEIRDLKVSATLRPGGRIDLVVSGRKGQTPVSVPYTAAVGL